MKLKFSLLHSFIVITSKLCVGQFDSVPKNVLENNKLFLNGESHFKKENNRIDITSFNYLYYNANVRVLLMEMGYTRGVLLNKYLVTGNDTLLWAVDQFSSSLSYFKQLRTFYLTLPATDKFIVKGIDEEGGDAGFVEALCLILPDREPPAEIKAVIANFKKETQYLKQHHVYDEIICKKYIYTFYEELKLHSDVYKTYLKSDYTDFTNIVNSQMVTPFFHRNSPFNMDYLNWRELFLYSNLIEVVKEHPDVNYYGQFGVLHVSLKYASRWSILKNWNSFASMANNDEDYPLKGKVCSFVIYYNNKRHCKSVYINKKVMKKYKNPDTENIIKYVPEEHRYASEQNYFNYIIVPSKER